MNVQDADSAEAIDKVYSVCAKVLKNNLQRKNLDINSIGVDACLVLLQDYFEFYTNELNKIVFLQSQ